MGEIVNLRIAKKRRQRDEQVRIAEENRARHGRTKGDKQRDRDQADRLGAHLDGHRLGPGDRSDE
ncbi:DUF4169 family protein [Mesorhizobium sp. LHD-90]|uniref:DUF4169 family protein n=1 Tax=Mesorhizobium sp. LHD-90 TaxID=3071414 RepID=UPI0027E173F7|nr:DUF4169 family protein [Mesorhizobium sp. LHD-90]MDQ6433514.1 DUF4169 family protein [Mesorhizobium sp. LHD-90]